MCMHYEQFIELTGMIAPIAFKTEQLWGSNIPQTKTYINLKTSCNWREVFFIEVPILDQLKSHILKFCVHFSFVSVNSIRFATCLNQISCNCGKTDSKTKKSNIKRFFQQKCFWSQPKIFASFLGVVVC